MTSARMTYVRWNPTTRILATHVSGVVSAGDVAAWKKDLEQATRALPDDGAFGMLVDLRGYEVAEQDLSVHKTMREVMPQLLAEHGFEVGFFKLFETAPSATRRTGSTLCVAVANVHHDEAKMARYNELLATESERFFHRAEDARVWLTDTVAGWAEVQTT